MPLIVRESVCDLTTSKPTRRKDSSGVLLGNTTCAKSGNYDFIGKNRRCGHLHDSMLCELLGVIGGCSAAQNEPLPLGHHVEVSDSPAQTALDLSFKVR